MIHTNQKGTTLLELTVVLLVLVALAGVAIPYVGGTGRMALCQATDASMQAIKSAIMGSGANAGFYMDSLGYYPKATKSATADYNLRYLYESSGWPAYNPQTAVGWRGPYLMSGAPVPAGLDDSFKNVYDPADATTYGYTVHIDITADNGSHVLDAWGRPIIIQVPYKSTAPAGYQLEYARLVSAGPGSGIGAANAVIDTTIHDNNEASNRGDDRVLYLKMPDPGVNEPC